MKHERLTGPAKGTMIIPGSIFDNHLGTRLKKALGYTAHPAGGMMLTKSKTIQFLTSLLAKIEKDEVEVYYLNHGSEMERREDPSGWLRTKPTGWEEISIRLKKKDQSPN